MLPNLPFRRKNSAALIVMTLKYSLKKSESSLQIIELPGFIRRLKYSPVFFHFDSTISVYEMRPEVVTEHVNCEARIRNKGGLDWV